MSNRILSSILQHLVRNLKKQAYLNVNGLMPINLPSIATPPRALSSLPTSDSITDLSSSEPHIDFPSLYQGIEDFKGTK